MGKRELLLAAVFIVLGLVVYQATSPPADPDRPGWSFSGIVERIRREVRGNSARAELTKHQTIAVPATLREIRLVRHPREVTIIGEDRADIQVDLHITSRAYDAAEAQRTAEETKLTTDHAGELLILSMYYPREGNQSATIALRVPKRLGLRVDDKGGKLTVSDVASVTLGPSRGETVLTNIAGPVQATQRGNSISITNAGGLRLSTFNTEARIAGIRGPVTLNLQGGEVRAEGIDGTIEIEARNTEMKFERLEKTRGPLRINAIGGEVVLNGLAAETRVDGRRTEVRVDQATAAPLSIYTEGDDAIEVTVPQDGFEVDALAIGARMTLDEALQNAGLSVATSPTSGGSDGSERQESRAAGKVRGGGPMITLRSNRGDIVLRSKS